jgi:carboxypeptidase family protein
VQALDDAGTRDGGAAGQEKVTLAQASARPFTGLGREAKLVVAGDSADNLGMPTGPWPLPNRSYDPDARPRRGSWLFKLATAVLLALLAFPFLPESVRVMFPEGMRLRIPRIELVPAGPGHEKGLLAGADSVKVNASAIAPEFSLDAPAVEPHEDVPVPKPVHASPKRRPHRVAHRVAQLPDEEIDPLENASYAPDYAVSMIPTTVKTEVRLSSPPASDAGGSGDAARPAGADENAARQDPARTDAADDDKEWPLFCGQVVDESGSPVEGARVELESPKLTVSTDAKGRFCVACPAGNRTVRIDAAGRGRATRIVALTGSLFEMRIELSR